MAQVKVSIIIPVFNAAEYLTRCIDSVLRQTLEEIEIICVDDGSTDRSAQIVRRFLKKDPRVVLIQQENAGAAKARNVGIDRAVGEYIGFVDSDDFVDDNYFMSLYNTAKKKNADIARGFVSVDSDESAVLAKFGHSEASSYEDYYNRDLLAAVKSDKRSFRGVVWIAIYRRALLNTRSIRFSERIRTGQDEVFNLEASHWANRIIVSPEQIHYHRLMRPGSLMTSYVHTDEGLLSRSWVFEETVRSLNVKKGYSKRVYIERVVGAIDFVYGRIAYLKNEIVTREIAVVLSDAWAHVKYKTSVCSMLVNVDGTFKRALGDADKLYRELRKHSYELDKEFDVSIIVPMYNQEAHIAHSIEMLKGQTHHNTQVIYVDDASSDATRHLAENVIGDDVRFTILAHDKNRGSAAARNTGLAHAKGRYVIFLDCDDVYSSELVSKVVAITKHSPADIVVYNFSIINEGSSVAGPSVLALDEISESVVSPEDIKDRLLNVFANNVWNKAFRREFLERGSLVFDTSLRRAQDALFTNQALVLADTIYYTPANLVTYRPGGAGSSWQSLHRYSTNGLDFIEKLHLFLRDRRLLSRYRKSFDNLCIDNINYTLVALAEHREFSPVYNKARRMVAQHKLETHRSDYFRDPNASLIIASIISGDMADYYRLLVGWLRGSNKTLAHQVDTLKRSLDVRKGVVAELESVYNSRSWRVTNAPRKLLHAVRRRSGS